MNLTSRDVVLLMKWFKLRFEREPTNDLGYFEEWLQRFERGVLIERMDNQSRVIWEKVLKG